MGLMTKKRSIPGSRKPRLKHIVCKPCWELKYCPYGPLVEFFPLPSDDLDSTTAKRSYDSRIDAVKAGDLKTTSEIYEAIEKILCLEPNRWRWIEQFQTEELRCSIFGHVCPVFFSAEPFTETREGRRTTRNNPREVMLKVVRRDGQICRSCGRSVTDDQVEFDHIIPISRGGTTSTENLRLLCRTCNRKKKDSLFEILDPDPFGHESEA
jgi:HNH endonuclease